MLLDKASSAVSWHAVEGSFKPCHRQRCVGLDKRNCSKSSPYTVVNAVRVREPYGTAQNSSSGTTGCGQCSVGTVVPRAVVFAAWRCKPSRVCHHPAEIRILQVCGCFCQSGLHAVLRCFWGQHFYMKSASVPHPAGVACPSARGWASARWDTRAGLMRGNGAWGRPVRS